MLFRCNDTIFLLHYLLTHLNLRLNILIPEKQQEPMEFLHGCLIKRFDEGLASAINYIICCSIKECKFLLSHKHALITAIPRVSCPKDIENDFRQVTILPRMAKLNCMRKINYS